MKLTFVIYSIVWYVTLSLAIYALSPKLIFLPPSPPTYNSLEGYIKIPVDENNYIIAKYLPNNKSKYVLIYSHGNAEDLGYLSGILEAYRDLGFSVLAYDYEGYGLSSGKCSESATYKDIDAIYRYALERLSISSYKIILLGRSLGTGPTLYLAEKEPVAGVILEAPFLSAFRVITQYQLLPLDRFNNEARAKNINAPVLLFHGAKDDLIPFSHSTRLKNNFKDITFIPLSNAGHNDMVNHMLPIYEEILPEFLDKIKKNSKNQPKL